MSSIDQDMKIKLPALSGTSHGTSLPDIEPMNAVELNEIFEPLVEKIKVAASSKTSSRMKSVIIAALNKLQADLQNIKDSTEAVDALLILTGLEQHLEIGSSLDFKENFKRLIASRGERIRGTQLDYCYNHGAVNQFLTTLASTLFETEINDRINEDIQSVYDVLLTDSKELFGKKLLGDDFLTEIPMPDDPHSFVRDSLGRVHTLYSAEAIGGTTYHEGVIGSAADKLYSRGEINAADIWTTTDHRDKITEAPQPLDAQVVRYIVDVLPTAKKLEQRRIEELSKNTEIELYKRFYILLVGMVAGANPESKLGLGKMQLEDTYVDELRKDYPSLVITTNPDGKYYVIGTGTEQQSGEITNTFVAEFADFWLREDIKPLHEKLKAIHDGKLWEDVIQHIIEPDKVKERTGSVVCFATTAINLEGLLKEKRVVTAFKRMSEGEPTDSAAATTKIDLDEELVGLADELKLSRQDVARKHLPPGAFACSMSMLQVLSQIKNDTLSISSIFHQLNAISDKSGLGEIINQDMFMFKAAPCYGNIDSYLTEYGYTSPALMLLTLVIKEKTGGSIDVHTLKSSASTEVLKTYIRYCFATSQSVPDSLMQHTLQRLIDDKKIVGGKRVRVDHSAFIVEMFNHGLHSDVKVACDDVRYLNVKVGNYLVLKGKDTQTKVVAREGTKVTLAMPKTKQITDPSSDTGYRFEPTWDDINESDNITIDLRQSARDYQLCNERGSSRMDIVPARLRGQSLGDYAIIVNQPSLLEAYLHGLIKTIPSERIPQEITFPNLYGNGPRTNIKFYDMARPIVKVLHQNPGIFTMSEQDFMKFVKASLDHGDNDTLIKLVQLAPESLMDQLNTEQFTLYSEDGSETWHRGLMTEALLTNDIPLLRVCLAKDKVQLSKSDEAQVLLSPKVDIKTLYEYISERYTHIQPSIVSRIFNQYILKLNKLLSANPPEMTAELSDTFRVLLFSIMSGSVPYVERFINCMKRMPQDLPLPLLDLMKSRLEYQLRRKIVLGYLMSGELNTLSMSRLQQLDVQALRSLINEAAVKGDDEFVSEIGQHMKWTAESFQALFKKFNGGDKLTRLRQILLKVEDLSEFPVDHIVQYYFKALINSDDSLLTHLDTFFKANATALESVSDIGQSTWLASFYRQVTEMHPMVVCQLYINQNGLSHPILDKFDMNEVINKLTPHQIKSLLNKCDDTTPLKTLIQIRIDHEPGLKLALEPLTKQKILETLSGDEQHALMIKLKEIYNCLYDNTAILNRLPKMMSFFRPTRKWQGEESLQQMFTYAERNATSRTAEVIQMALRNIDVILESCTDDESKMKLFKEIRQASLATKGARTHLQLHTHSRFSDVINYSKLHPNTRTSSILTSMQNIGLDCSDSSRTSTYVSYGPAV